MLPIKPEWNEAWLRTGFMSAMSTIVIEDETKLGTVIGIDLGTTHSCVGVYKDGHVEIVPNDHGNRITPSWVAFTDSQRLIGEAAKNQAAANAKRTIFDVKRLIGRNFQDKEFQRVYEGESSLPKDCTLLGTLQFSGITSGTHQFEVTFEVDASGILIVTAEGKASGKSEKMTFKGRLSQEEIERMVKEEEFYASVEKKLKENIDARNTLEKYIYARKSEMKNRNELAGKLERDDKKKMEAALKDALEWLNDNHSAEEEEFHEKLKELRAVCSPIITEAFTKYGLGPVGDLQSTEDDEARL